MSKKGYPKTWNWETGDDPKAYDITRRMAERFDREAEKITESIDKTIKRETYQCLKLAFVYPGPHIDSGLSAEFAFKNHKLVLRLCPHGMYGEIGADIPLDQIVDDMAFWENSHETAQWAAKYLRGLVKRLDKLQAASASDQVRKNHDGSEHQPVRRKG